MNYPYTHSVVLLPEHRITKAACQLSQQAASQEESYFTLQEQPPFIPHVSLYFLNCPAGKIDDVATEIKRIAELAKPLTINGGRVCYLGYGHLEVTYDTSPELKALQTQVMDAINPLRGPNNNKALSRASSVKSPTKDLIVKYGYPNVGELFRPHITLTRFKDDLQRQPKLDPTTMSGVADRIALCTLGDHGTCIDEVAVFRL